MSRPGAIQLWRMACALFWMMPSVTFAAERPTAAPVVQFRTERAGMVSINLYRPDGTLARRLVQAQRLPAGAHKVPWDGRGDDGITVGPGEYTWRGLFHEGIGLKLRGWVGNGCTTPWSTPDGKGNWGGDAGVPSAVAADAQRVYLGWSLAEQGRAILGCDLEGRVQWGHRRKEGASGCKALAVDDGILYVLGGLAGTDAEGGSVYRLNAKDGKPVPWPNGQLDLKIASFWPADAKTRPDKADAMAVRHDRIYLTFTSSEFLTVLDAKTGAYLQTIVGAPPGQIDVAPTKTDLPDAPGKLVDADFAVISLGGGVLGKVLMAHDPLWVVTSELSPVERDVRVNALTVIGDGAKFHRHTAFVGLDAPFHQVQARPLLDMEGYTWAAGKPGGRPLLGPWQPDALRAIRGVALDAAGKLWVAEGDGFPKRFSVWDTSGQQGKLVREFFGPPQTRASDGAINPLDPEVMVAQGCEWRIDRKTGLAACLGVITREEVAWARFGVGENGRSYLAASSDSSGGCPVSIFERLGEGDYKLRARIYQTLEDGREALGSDQKSATTTVFWSDRNGDGEVQADEKTSVPYPVHPRVRWMAQDLTLQCVIKRAEQVGCLLKVASWTACGAPEYRPDAAIWLPRDVGVTGPVSPDGRLVLAPVFAGQGPISCYEISTGRELWKLPAIHASDIDLDLSDRIGGSARMPEPLKNLWIVASLSGTWRILTEDGFDLGRFFARDADKQQWPKVAVPGADLTNAHPQGAWSGNVTQASDGKLYLQTGASAYWNLEVTGLEKVRALSGGKLDIPAAK
jgi:hypothetical protein